MLKGFLQTEIKEDWRVTEDHTKQQQQQQTGKSDYIDECQNFEAL